MAIVHEGAAVIEAELPKKVSREMGVFYNPVMKLNRDVSILLLNSLGKEGLQVADPLAGSGIRAVRFLLEVKPGVIKSIACNDSSPMACEAIGQNFALNKVDPQNVTISTLDASRFLLESTGFDYIDIDPFGSPNPFLDAAIKRLSRGGILAVTATDTSALSGSSPNACVRKYWATPLKNHCMHETGLRILVRKVQLIAAQYQRALTPVFCYSKEHYYRLFFQCMKGRSRADKLLARHSYISFCTECPHTTLGLKEKCACGSSMNATGPLWLGKLWDERLAEHMFLGVQPRQPAYSLLLRIREESQADSVGFFTLPMLAKRENSVPSMASVLDMIRKAGFYATRTHLDGQGIKSNIPAEVLNQLPFSHL